MKSSISKRFKNNREALISVILVMGIVAALNFFSYHWFWRLDLTAGRLYSLSPASKELVAKLPDVVNVKVYFSKNLPAQYDAVRQGLADLLAEYQSYSSNLRVEYLDPGDGKEIEALGIPKLQINDYRQDKIEVVTGYLGLALSYQGKTEIIPVIENTDNLEYQISALLKKLTANELPAIGIVSGHGSPAVNRELRETYQAIGKFYRMELVSLDKIPDQTKALVIIGPKENFSDEELKKLDEFLMKGNSLAVLLDGVLVDERLEPLENKTNLNEFLAKYGIKVTKDLVLDPVSGVASFSQGPVTFNVNYPFWPRVLNKNFDQESPLVSGLDGVILPWVSNVTVDESRLDQRTQVSYLADSSRDAWLASGSYRLEPDQPLTPSGERGRRHLVVALSGKLKSAYGEASTDKGRLLVVGDADFVQDNFWRGNPTNLVFFQNLLDGVSQDLSLTGIRTKQAADRHLGEQPEQLKEILRYGNIFGVTAVVLIFGLLRYYFRRKTKNIEF